MTGVVFNHRHILREDVGSIGIGAMIIFIATILVAGIAANVLIQTMNSLETQALRTGENTIREVSGGLKITQVSGYTSSSLITQLALFVTPMAGSEDLDLSAVYISLSDTSKSVILTYDSTTFSSSATGGLFSTLNTSNLSSNEFGLIVIRDIDTSCTSSTPVINDQDLVALIVNTTSCFSGINPRCDVSGYVIPEFGMRGVISFTTPSAFINTIISLQ